MQVKKPVFTISSVLMLGITVFINWFLIFALVSLFVPNSPQASIIYSIIIVIALAGLSLTPAAESIVRFQFGCKAPTPDELNKIKTAWDDVLKASGVDARKYQPELFVANQPIPNAFAMATKTICVTKGLLQIGTQDELAGVLAHELGHLENGDTKRAMIVHVINSLGNIIALAFLGMASILGFSGQIFGAAARSGQLFFIGWIISLTALFFKICLWVIQWLISIGYLAVGRQQEFEADAYAQNIGFGGGLVSFLRKLETTNVRPAGVWAAMYSTHPPVSKRLEKLLHSGDSTARIQEKSLKN